MQECIAIQNLVPLEWADFVSFLQKSKEFLNDQITKGRSHARLREGAGNANVAARAKTEISGSSSAAAGAAAQVVVSTQAPVNTQSSIGTGPFREWKQEDAEGRGVARHRGEGSPGGSSLGRRPPSHGYGDGRRVGEVVGEEKIVGAAGAVTWEDSRAGTEPEYFSEEDVAVFRDFLLALQRYDKGRTGVIPAAAVGCVLHDLRLREQAVGVFWL